MIQESPKSEIMYRIVIVLITMNICLVSASDAQEHGDHTHLPVNYNLETEKSADHEPVEADKDGYYWWKGNLHTHTLWSDGDQFPEVVTQWYYKHGYHFLAISDHNILLRGDKWIDPEDNPYTDQAGDKEVYELYLERFGEDWVETRSTSEGNKEVRLKPLNEFRSLFEEAGRFLLIDSEEITETDYQVHVNATNILELIEPVTGKDVEETIQKNIEAVKKQRRETGRKMIANLNHPNWQHAITAEAMAPVEELQFFEVYNGHRGTFNFGDDREKGVKNLGRLWDIVLTKRIGELDLGLIYGIAADDAHHYEGSEQEVAEPGRGWVRVRSQYLTPESIVGALEDGEFYASSGVSIQSIKQKDDSYQVKVDSEDGVQYKIKFIGTREGYDDSREYFTGENGQKLSNKTMNYSNDIGETLKEINGTNATYEFEGDELYVRAKIISSKNKENYFEEGEREKAWTQPVIVNR